MTNKYLSALSPKEDSGKGGSASLRENNETYIMNILNDHLGKTRILWNLPFFVDSTPFTPPRCHHGFDLYRPQMASRACCSRGWEAVSLHLWRKLID